MTRSESIYGKVIRNVEKYRKFSDADFAFIWDEINSAITEIISRVIIQKSIEIPLGSDQSDYDLQAYVRSIAAILRPEIWTEQISIVTKENWDRITHIDSASIQPLWGTIYESKVRFYPVSNLPYTVAEDTEGTQKITAICDLKAPSVIVSATVEPEIPNIWDKAIEFYATAQFLAGDEETKYLLYFDQQVKEKAATDYTQNTDSVVQGNW